MGRKKLEKKLEKKLVGISVDKTLLKKYRATLMLEGKTMTSDLEEYMNDRISGKVHANAEFSKSKDKTRSTLRFDPDTYFKYRQVLKDEGITITDDITGYIVEYLDGRI